MLPLCVSLSAQLPLARDKQPYYFTLLTVQWTMTVSHGVFWWSCGGVPSHQIRTETVALALAESSGFTLLNAVIKIELAWMIDRFSRKSYFSCWPCLLGVPTSHSSLLNQLANDKVTPHVSLPSRTTYSGKSNKTSTQSELPKRTFLICVTYEPSTINSPLSQWDRSRHSDNVCCLYLYPTPI